MTFRGDYLGNTNFSLLHTLASLWGPRCSLYNKYQSCWILNFASETFKNQKAPKNGTFNENGIYGSSFYSYLSVIKKYVLASAKVPRLKKLRKKCKKILHTIRAYFVLMILHTKCKVNCIQKVHKMYYAQKMH